MRGKMGEGDSMTLSFHFGAHAPYLFGAYGLAGIVLVGHGLWRYRQWMKYRQSLKS